MNTSVIVALLGFLAVATAEYAFPSARILEGPSAKSEIVGPDGSSISSFAPGGRVISENHGYGYAAPLITKTFVNHGYVAPYDTLIEGPSGTIARKGYFPDNYFYF